MLVKDHYQGIIREIMREHRISPGRPAFDHMVPINASFEDVVRHTDRFVGKGHDEQPNNTAHYRYGRYFGVLRNLSADGKRIAHVDIGCGAGVFSWAYLDWVIDNGIGLENVDLYGFDYSPAMISLARQIATRLNNVIPGYPYLRYYENMTSLLLRLKEPWRKVPSYIITLGHLLVQVQDQEDSGQSMNQFVQIISQVCSNMDDGSTCDLVAVDAIRRSITFGKAWDSLREKLESNGIYVKSSRGPSAVVASLYLT